MSHNIETTKRGASLAFTGETPWHRLGQKIKEAFDAKTALKEARLDFTVEKTPIACADTKTVIPNRFAVRRTDTQDVLGIVGGSYVPCQNREAFAFFDGVFGKDKARYECAGVLGKGERIWLLAKLPGNFTIGKDDVVNKFLLLTNSHDADTRELAPAIQSRVAACDKLHETGLGVKLPAVRGTLWGAYNALVEHLDHERTTDSVKYIANGTGAVIKARAYTLARALAVGNN